MTTLSIADIPWISKRIKACCRRAKLFSTDELLLSTPQQLQQALRISRADVDLLLLHVATAAAPPPVSVLDALNGKLPSTLQDNLFDADPNDVDSAQDSDDTDADDEAALTAGFPSASVVPPTQGYDGNFPGAERYVYDSDSDSDSDSAAQSDAMVHDDVEMPSTFRPRPPPTFHNDTHGQSDQTFNPDGETLPAQPPATRDVLALGRDRHILTTGSRELDSLLNGGFRSGALTELVGESGAGKTQLAIQTCTYAASGLSPLPPSDEPRPSPISTLDEEATLRDILQGYGMTSWTNPTTSRRGLGACYITSSGERGAHSIVQRALQLDEYAIRERFQRLHFPSSESSQSAIDREVLLARALELGRDQVLRNLHVACVADVEALEHALKYSLPGVIHRLAPSCEVGLVVVDNLPALFQADPVASSDIDSLVYRSKMLIDLAEALKRLAGMERVVLVLNHVSDAFGAEKEIARRFVFDSATRIRNAGVGVGDYPVAMEYAAQSAFFSGLLASIPPTLAEAISAQGVREGAGELYALHPRTAQLGHTWANLVNVRLFLAKTRGRVTLPPSQPPSAALEAEEEGKEKGRLTTVRKAAVVLNAFGPSMLDASHVEEKGKRRTEERQLRFAITTSAAVHALKLYSLPTTTTASTTRTSPHNDDEAEVEYEENEEEEQAWLAHIDQLEQTQLTAIQPS